MQKFDARDLHLQIDRKELKQFYQINTFRHASAIAFNWMVIIATAWLSIQFFHPLLYVGAVIIIGARMHALAILMHDASHYRFMKNKKWNDILTNVTTMYLVFSSIEKYRQNHLRHHMHLNTEEDPDWLAKLGRQEFTFPKTKREFLGTLLSYFFLYRGVMDAIWIFGRFKAPAKGKGAENKVLKIGFYLVLATVLTLTGAWSYYLLYWVIPYFSTFFMFQYIRSVAEHFGDLDHDHLLTSTRTLVQLRAWEKFLFAPHNVGYHLEHHLYPGVPFYSLPRLHHKLMQDENYAGKAHLTKGYLGGLLNELS